ncbi:IS630 family transposase ISRso5 [Cupriavidus laharis]|uniref:IS630 family transposase ISRso5 n=2 Tax=Cupriavidus TaxID=106589 RepID=A0ABN7ZK55_9BURK|nr:IS630 family transposase ISRso5 [Cupriavidus pinatubonensis]CAG9185385.1 IS630 family transposase ISRso5 [Cupriavidus laharis]
MGFGYVEGVTHDYVRHGTTTLFAALKLELHLIVDNYITHKHGKVKTWLARHPRFHLHFTPTYSSWLNQVERWFALITERAIRRNSFTSVRQLRQQIDLFVQRYNADATPFRWAAIADSILQKIERLAKRISCNDPVKCSVPVYAV